MTLFLAHSQGCEQEQHLRTLHFPPSTGTCFPGHRLCLLPFLRMSMKAKDRTDWRTLHVGLPFWAASELSRRAVHFR